MVEVSVTVSQGNDLDFNARAVQLTRNLIPCQIQSTPTSAAFLQNLLRADRNRRNDFVPTIRNRLVGSWGAILTVAPPSCSPPEFNHRNIKSAIVRLWEPMMEQSASQQKETYRPARQTRTQTAFSLYQPCLRWSFLDCEVVVNNILPKSKSESGRCQWIAVVTVFAGRERGASISPKSVGSSLHGNDPLSLVEAFDAAACSFSVPSQLLSSRRNQCYVHGSLATSISKLVLGCFA